MGLGSLPYVFALQYITGTFDSFYIVASYSISVIYLLFSGIMIMIPPPPPPLPAYPASPFPFPLAQILQYCIVDNLKVGGIRLFKNHKGQTDNGP